MTFFRFLISYAHFLIIFECNAANHTSQQPAIYIDYRDDQSSALIPPLRTQYQMCVSEKRLYQSIKQQGIAWKAAQRDLPPGYIVDGDPLPEPDWKKEKVGIFKEQQYHFRDKYAQLAYRTNYSFSNDGLCRLIKTESVNIEKDNGKYRYLITLRNRIPAGASPSSGGISLATLYKDKSIRRMNSRAITHKQAQSNLAKLKNNPGLADLVSRGLADSTISRTPGTPARANQHTIDLLDKATQISVSKAVSGVLPKANDEHIVLGQPCDIVSSKVLPGRSWLWQPMHKYPGPVARNIILKTESTPFGQSSKSVKEAIRFEVNKDFDSAIFHAAWPTALLAEHPAHRLGPTSTQLIYWTRQRRFLLARLSPGFYQRPMMSISSWVSLATLFQVKYYLAVPGSGNPCTNIPALSRGILF